MKRILSAVLCAVMLFTLTACGGSTEETKAEYTPVNDGVLWGAEYEGTKVEVLSYEYDEDWHSYADVAEGPAVIVRFYFENDGADPLYMLESFGVFPYQDGTELDYISLNSDDEECTNVTKSVKDGAGIYCKMAFKTISDSDTELRILEPTAEAATIGTLTLAKGADVSILTESDRLENDVIGNFANTTEDDLVLSASVAFIQNDGVIGSTSADNVVIPAGESRFVLFEFGTDFTDYEISHSTNKSTVSVSLNVQEKDDNDGITYTVSNSESDSFNASLYIFYLSGDGSVVGYDRETFGTSEGAYEVHFDKPDYEYTQYAVTLIAE